MTKFEATSMQDHPRKERGKERERERERESEAKGKIFTINSAIKFGSVQQDLD